MAATLDMMNKMNISSIETFFDTLLRGTLTDNLFFGELPPQLKDNWQTMVVVDCANAVRDYDAVGFGTVLIMTYAKQNAYGIKNVKGLQGLEKKLNELILSNTDPSYTISRRGSYSHYDAVNDIYFNVTQINLVIS